MKKLLAWFLLAATVLSLFGCATVSAPEVTTQPETTAAPVTVAPTVPTETEPPILEGDLYLKVSSITFTLVGESEDIYLGLIPREEVTWESDDPGIVSVENGVLTANGVGTTTIRAAYHDREISCTAGCLAQTREDLAQLNASVLAAPKRLPPELDLEEACTELDSAALIGDSITYILSQWEGQYDYLGDVQFLCRGGVSMNGFVRRFKNLYFRGKEMYLEDAVAASGAERLYFLMGSNDISDEIQRSYVFENWTTMLERIRTQVPDIEIVVMSNTPQFPQEYNVDKKNDLIEEYNENLRTFAGENGCMYLDLAYYIQDHYGRMPQSYNLDGYHMNETGNLVWMKILRFYAQYESEGGTLS